MQRSKFGRAQIFLSRGTISDLRRRALGGLMGEWRNGLRTTRGTRPTAFDLPNISEEFGTERGARRTTGICRPSINDLVPQEMLTR
jgi:hypothetical protein